MIYIYIYNGKVQYHRSLQNDPCKCEMLNFKSDTFENFLKRTGKKFSFLCFGKICRDIKVQY